MTKTPNANIQDTSGTSTDISRDSVSRRVVLGGAALAVGVGATCMMATNASAKVAQADVKYQGEPKGEAKCGTCSQFQPPDGCVAVDGKVSENGWCQLYVKKG